MRNYVTAIMLILGIVVTEIGLTSHTTRQSEPVTQNTADSFDLSNGKKLFLKHCSPCHGQNGEGIENGPPNLCDNYWIHGHHYHNIRHIIHHGYHQRGMVSFKHVLNHAQTRDVAHYVYISLKGTTPINAAPPKGTYYK